ncbi:MULTISPECIES: GLPGLI family protein [Niastella]|uniref:GLPGLI family protein n=1 Tax=Niastella soli TaxID=2821487 RepID=A0ABS3YYQ5_9BACT|nr:GLPGLI family protein [Niastella soli]MBO9203062.1 GLPGLI family protein [Niastella soli]
MLKISSITILLCCVLKVQAQQTKQIGKATYEVASGSNHPIIDCWFSTQEYTYQYRKIRDARQLPQFKNKTYSSIEDSLKDVRIIEKFNEGLKSMPEQFWYGQLGDNVVVYSSFDNENKQYCIRDTIKWVTWELSSDTTTILGQTCQKAIGKLNGIAYTAWFSTAIPVSTAPLQFRGLPGLLMKVTNEMNKVTVSLIDLEWPANNQKIVMAPCTAFPFISKQELQAIREKQNADAYKLAESIKKNGTKSGNQ